LNMKCPICQDQKLQKTLINQTEIDYCQNCLGIWFDKGELDEIKNAKDETLAWLDVDLWKNPNKFKVVYGIRLCPACRVPLYEVRYGDSDVIIDVCNICHGLWTDRAEFKKIMSWLSSKADYEIMRNYSKNLFLEFVEIFSGPESIRDEILDFVILLKIFGYRFAGENPQLASLMAHIPVR